MCLGIPARVLSVNGDKAMVAVGGTQYEASIQLLEDVKPEDYVLLHTGFALEKISEEEAVETFRILKALDEIEDDIEAAEGKPEI